MMRQTTEAIRNEQQSRMGMLNRYENRYPRGLRVNPIVIRDCRSRNQSLPISIQEKSDLIVQLGSERLENQREMKQSLTDLP
jgi:hypothetical protein